LRATPGLEHLPLVAVTSYAMAGDHEKALRSGFVGYIEKPISTDRFVSQIQSFLPA
jgi:CheY-like chemotaxis protein